MTALFLALTPAVAIAQHGADDPPGDDRGGQRAAGQSDDGPGDDRRRGDDETRVSGSCTRGSTAKLKAKHDDGRLEVEFEVDQNRSGVRWKVRVRRNGKLAIKTSAVTGGRSGSFSVERKIADPAGRDRISARATSPSGEVCRAALTI
ncbi:MAG TPA: hypothetical protein VFZ00_08690 [Solirubrobacter sp.]|nr:hypothetical protein [Solirubrobacter sp.]